MACSWASMGLAGFRESVELTGVHSLLLLLIHSTIWKERAPGTKRAFAPKWGV